MGSEQLIFEAYPPAHRHLDVVGTVGESVAMLRRAIQDADWSAVRTRSWQCLGLGCGALRTLALDDRHAAALDERRVATRVAMIDRMKRAAGTAAGRVRLGEARAELERTSPEVAAAQRALLDKLVVGDTSPLESATREHRKRGRSVAHDLAIAARVRGVLGLVHGEFNAALALEKHRTDPSSLHKAATASVESVEKLLRAHQRRLFDAFVSGHRDSAAQESNAIIDLLERRLPRFAVGLARSHAAASSLRESGKGGAAERLGMVAVQGGTLLREAIATLAACLRIVVEFDLSWSSDVEDMFGSAPTLALDAVLTDGKNVQLAKLAGVADGTLVDVFGCVTRVDAVHPNEKKLIGRIELVDPSSDAKAWVAGVYVHPAHVGIVTGSYIRATGTFRTASKLRAGEPTVEVEAIALTALASKGWRIALLGLARPWYSPWPNRLALEWSVGPHAPTTHDEGAGELVYPPIVRKEQ